MHTIVNMKWVIESIAVQAKRHLSCAKMPGDINRFAAFINSSVSCLRVLMTKSAQGKTAVIGQIHGYFDNDVPDLFFRLMALYIATNTISSIPWAIPFGDAEVEYMRSNAAAIFQFYDGFQTYVPSWYENPT